jgi:hypothetical protein
VVEFAGLLKSRSPFAVVASFSSAQLKAGKGLIHVFEMAFFMVISHQPLSNGLALAFQPYMFAMARKVANTTTIKRMKSFTSSSF